MSGAFSPANEIGNVTSTDDKSTDDKTTRKLKEQEKAALDNVSEGYDKKPWTPDERPDPEPGLERGKMNPTGTRTDTAQKP